MGKKLPVKELDGFGLTSYESRIYLSLLEKELLTAAEVSHLANVPRTRVYDNLRSLELKGMCSVYTGDKKLYVATDPSCLKDILINHQNEIIKEKEERTKREIEKEKEKLALELQKEKIRFTNKAKSAEEIIKQLSYLYEKNHDGKNPLNYLEIVMTPLQIHRKFVGLVNESKEEILGFHKYPLSSTTKEQKIQSINSFLKAQERGVNIKGICELPEEKSERDDCLKSFFKNYEPGTDQSRITNNLPMKLFIYDSKVVFFSLTEPTIGVESMCCLVARSEALAKSFKKLFELYWNQADDPEKYRESGNPDF